MNEQTKGATVAEIAWIRELDWSKVSVGDEVRVVNEDGAEADVWVVDTYFRGDNSLCIRTDNYVYHNASWKLFVRAPATPIVPVEPGYYVDSKGRLFTRWGGPLMSGEADRMASLNLVGPFVRLESVSETAKKVIDRVAALRAEAERYDLTGASTRDMLRELIHALSVDFGVDL